MLKCSEAEILFCSNLLHIAKTYFIISVNEKQKVGFENIATGLSANNLLIL
jgi:hypothetical protein